MSCLKAIDYLIEMEYNLAISICNG